MNEAWVRRDERLRIAALFLAEYRSTPGATIYVAEVLQRISERDKKNENT